MPDLLGLVHAEFGAGSVSSGRIRAGNSPSTSSCTACMCCTRLLRRARLGRRIFLHF